MKPGLDFFRTQSIHEGDGDSMPEVLQRHESQHPKNHQVKQSREGFFEIALELGLLASRSAWDRHSLSGTGNEGEYTILDMLLHCILSNLRLSLQSFLPSNASLSSNTMGEAER